MRRRHYAVAPISFVLVLAWIHMAAGDAGAYSATVDKTQVVQGECLTLSWSGFGDTTNIAVYKGSAFWIYANTQAHYQGTQQICTSNWEFRSDYKIRVELKSNTTIYVYTQSFAVLGPKPYLMDFLINGGGASTSSTTVYLQNNYTTATPTHYMASENENFAGAVWNSYESTPSFSLSSGAGIKFVHLKLKNEWGESNTKFDNISYEPIVYYYMSGFIRDGNGQGISGVILNGFPAGSTGSKTTENDGSFLVSNIISTWAGTITPSKTGYTFSPPSRSYDGLAGNLSSQNFTATSNETYSWQTGEWGPCHDTCGGGGKTRAVLCLRNSDAQHVADSYCTAAKPAAESSDCPALGPSRLINTMGGEKYTAPQ